MTLCRNLSSNNFAQSNFSNTETLILNFGVNFLKEHRKARHLQVKKGTSPQNLNSQLSISFLQSKGIHRIASPFRCRYSKCHSSLQKIIIHKICNTLFQVVSSLKKICQCSKLHTASNIIIKEYSAILAIAFNNSI